MAIVGGIAKPAFPVLRRGHPLAQGLLLAYAMYEGSGLSLNDISGYNRVGTFVNGPTWQGAQSGWNLSFTRSGGQYVTLNDTGFPTGAAPRTVVFGFTDIASGGNEFAFGHGRPTGNDLFTVGLFNNSGQVLGVANNGVGVNGNTTGLSNGTYHVGGVSYDGTNANFYVDGNADGVQALTVNTTLTGTAVVGQYGGGQYWNGTIDFVLFYNRSLSASEQAELAQDPFCWCRRPRTILKPAGVVAAPPWGWETVSPLHVNDRIIPIPY